MNSILLARSDITGLSSQTPLLPDEAVNNSSSAQRRRVSSYVSSAPAAQSPPLAQASPPSSPSSSRSTSPTRVVSVDLTTYEEHCVRAPMRKRLRHLLDFESAQDGCHEHERTATAHPVFASYVDILCEQYGLTERSTSRFGVELGPADRAARAANSLCGVVRDAALPWHLFQNSHRPCALDGCLHRQEVRVNHVRVEYSAAKCSLRITFLVDQHTFVGDLMLYRCK